METKRWGPTSSEDELLRAARAGDQPALAALLERHQGAVYRFGLKMCRHPQDAEDVLQETLLAAARSLHQFRGGSSLGTWLYAIARSVCIKRRRRSKFAPAAPLSLEAAQAQGTPEVAALVHPDLGPEQRAVGEQTRRALETALGSLAPSAREVLVLRDLEGLAAAEVARALGLSVGAVKSRLHRARAEVRAQLERALGEAPVRASAECPDVLRLYSQHLEGDISAEVCARMERHLEQCVRCRATCDSLKRALAVCSQLPQEEVPPAVQARVRRALRAALGP